MRRPGRRGEEHPINEDFVDDMNEAYESFGAMAERVIGHAYKARCCSFREALSCMHFAPQKVLAHGQCIWCNIES